MDQIRTEAELKSVGIYVGHTGIYHILKKRGLNIAKARLEWVRKLSLRDSHSR